MTTCTETSKSIFLLYIRHGSVSLALTHEFLRKYSALQLWLLMYVVHQLAYCQPRSC